MARTKVTHTGCPFQADNMWRSGSIKIGVRIQALDYIGLGWLVDAVVWAIFKIMGKMETGVSIKGKEDGEATEV